jgi:uncharacterized protein (DUF488 family)
MSEVPHGPAALWRDRRVYTVGHSTRTLDELIALLRAFQIEILVDVRTIPRSRHNQQFGAGPLRAALRLPRSGFVQGLFRHLGHTVMRA